MNSSAYMALSSLLYIILLLIVFFYKKRVSYIENKIYIGMMISIFISLIIFLISSIFADILINYPLYNEFILKLYTISLEVWITELTIYTYSSSQKETEKKPRKVKRYITIFTVIASVLALLTFILPIEYLVNEQNQYYIGGPCVNIVYIYSLILILINIYLLIRHIKTIGIKKFIPLITFIFLGIITIFITLKVPGLLLITPLEAFITFIMYFTIENPDLNMLKEINYQREQVENSKNISNKVINTISDSLSESVNKISTFGHKKINYDNTEELKKEITEVQKFALEFVGDINSLMELSKTQSEGFELSNTNYEPLQMLEETSNLLTTKNKNIKVTINKNSDVPAVLYGDPAKIKQCMLHLYTGILNISKVKNIDLNISYLIVGGLCRFKVSTDINASDLLNEYTKDLKDTVIDFEIIDRIIKLLEGKWSIELIGNKIVKIELSIDQKYLEGYYIKEETKSTMSKKINYSNLADKKVLIIDDDKQRTDEIMHLLSNYNIETTVAADYNSTKKECTEKTFDLVIVDDIITELDRVKDFLLIDKTNGLLKVMDHIEYDVPRVIMVTPNTKDYETKYLEEGFDEVLTKPVDKYKLDTIIKAFLENSEDKDM